MPDRQGRKASPLPLLTTGLTLLGVLLILIGFFSPWVPHSTAGLALTGFEIGEWIKFAPEMRGEAPPLRRTNFYWPPVVAATGLAMLAAGARSWRLGDWLLIVLAALLSLFPFPLLEEIRGLGGVTASAGRFALVALGVAAAALAIWRRALPPRIRGLVLVANGALGVWMVSTAFSEAEPIVERLYAHLIDPGLGYNLTRGGMLILVLVGIFYLLYQAPVNSPQA